MKTWVGISITHLKFSVIAQDWYPVLLQEMGSRIIGIPEACGSISLAWRVMDSRETLPRCKRQILRSRVVLWPPHMFRSMCILAHTHTYMHMCAYTHTQLKEGRRHKFYWRDPGSCKYNSIRLNIEVLKDSEGQKKKENQLRKYLKLQRMKASESKKDLFLHLPDEQPHTRHTKQETNRNSQR